MHIPLVFQKDSMPYAEETAHTKQGIYRFYQGGTFMSSTKSSKPKRFRSLLLSLAMVIGMFPIIGTTTASALTGNGDHIADPYLVDTYDELRQAMKNRAWISDSSNDSATYITLNSDILIEDSTADYYLETFPSTDHKLYLNLNGHLLIRRTDSSDKYMFNVKCHLVIGDRKGGGTIRFKTTASDGDTAVFSHDQYNGLLEIIEGAYVVNDTAEHSGYTNCGVISKNSMASTYLGDCRIAAQLPLKISKCRTCYVDGASLCSTSKSSYVALNSNRSLSIDNCTAYGDIIINSGYYYKVSESFQGTTIYRNGIKKDFSSILDSYSATIPANGGVLTVTNHEDPFIANVDITDVTAPLGSTKVGDFKYTVATENVIDMGVTVISPSGIALTSDKLFVGGETYDYYIHVMPKGGYMLKANAITGVSTGTINGESVETVTHPSWYSSMGTDIRLISTFTAIPVVTEFSAKVKAPVVGTPPSFVAIPGDSKAYTATVADWEEVKPGANYTTYMSEDSAFQYGCIYKLYVKFEIKEGYSFPSAITKIPGIINSQTGEQVLAQPQKGIVEYVISYTMPDAPVPENGITVYYGDARNSSGYIITRAAPGTKVTLTADEPSEGEVFDYWHVSDDTVAVENPYSPTTTFIMPDSYVSIVARYKDKVEGSFTVSGTVTSAGSDDDDVIVQLIAEGTSKAAYETTVKGNTAEYSIEGVPAGVYTLRVMKQNHVTRAYTVTVGAENVTQDVTLYLWGDADGNGTINTSDARIVLQSAVGKVTLTEEQSLCTDVDGSGAIDSTDARYILQYAVKRISSFPAQST